MIEKDYMGEGHEGTVYSRGVIDFVTVSAEFCVRVERAGETPLASFVSAMLKILPLLYVKAMVVSEEVSQVDDDFDGVEHLVTEDDYNYVLESVANLLGSHDDYLDVFVEDMKYSDTPIRKTISEDLADIYQDLRNFVAIYRQDCLEATQAALAEVMADFPVYWGQRITCVMRALHDVMFMQENQEEKE